jgi:CSLREA domain-containing protein
MQNPLRLSVLLPLLAVAACSDEQPPTGPTTSVEGLSFSGSGGQRVVNSVADPGDGTCNARQCTLREAINAAGSTDISFAPGLTGPITLAKLGNGGGQLVINKPLTITGPRGGIVIRRRSGDPDFRIFRIGASGDVTLTNLIIRNGRQADREGGGILNDGKLVLVSSTLSNNSADQGGGIYNHGRLILRNTTISGNSARSAGGIDNYGRLTGTESTIANNSGEGIVNHNNVTTILTTSKVTGNSGRGISNDGGGLTLTNSTVSGNEGGGIFQARGGATLTLVRVVDNSTSFKGGGIFVGAVGSMTLRNSTVARNSATDGGGIAVRGGTITITRSTIAGNSATNWGGGILNLNIVRQGSDLAVTNSTISGNSASTGGGIYNSGDLAGAIATLTNSTVARNSATRAGGGISQESSSSGLFLRNTLVAQNTAPTGPDVSNDEQGFVDARFNLIGDGSGSGISNTNGNQVGTSSSPIDPRIGPLANNGGPTRTHALLAGSPAIDAASSADCPATDQRGVSRPQGAGCDIGSYERE